MSKKARLGTDYGKWSTHSIFWALFWISDILLFCSVIAVHFLPNYLLNPSLNSFHILSSILSIRILFPYYVYTFPILRAGRNLRFLSSFETVCALYLGGWVSDLSPLPLSSLKHCALNALSNRERIILTIASLLLIVFQFTPEGMTSVLPTPAHLDCIAALSIRCLSTSEHITRVAARVAFLFLAHFPMRRANHLTTCLISLRSILIFPVL